jgi:hypothetical protein
MRHRDFDQSEAVSGEGEADRIDHAKHTNDSGKETIDEAATQPITTHGNDGRVALPTHPEHPDESFDGRSDKMVLSQPAGADDQQIEAVSRQSPIAVNNRETADEAGEEVVEAAEDTVIY